MRIAHKLTLGSLLLASLIWAAGFYAVAVSRRALRRSIEGASARQAAEVMDEVDRAIHGSIDDWRVSSPMTETLISESWLVTQVLENFVPGFDSEPATRPKQRSRFCRNRSNNTTLFPKTNNGSL